MLFFSCVLIAVVMEYRLAHDFQWIFMDCSMVYLLTCAPLNVSGFSSYCCFSIALSPQENVVSPVDGGRTYYTDKSITLVNISLI